MTCERRPAHPCPPSPAPSVSLPESEAGTFQEKLKTLFGSEPVKQSVSHETNRETRHCTEKARLRWEAMLMHAHADCMSKLARVRKLLIIYQGQEDGLAPAP